MKFETFKCLILGIDKQIILDNQRDKRLSDAFENESIINSETELINEVLDALEYEYSDSYDQLHEFIYNGDKESTVMNNDLKKLWEELEDMNYE